MQRLDQERCRAKSSPRIPEEVWQWIEGILREYWNPKQISRWLTREKRHHVSHERTHQHILQDKRPAVTCTYICAAISPA